MDPPLPSSAHHDLTDYPQSEVESLSDSDWLDVSSSRESDDLESVGSDLEYRARSRRSSNSNGSSHDGLVEAWEGLADETPDDGLPADDDHTLATVFPVLPDDTISYPPLPTAEQPHVQTSDSEPADDEEKLKAALDQSMISTLSSSRSSSLGGMSHSRSTVHSTRDLRLSFPDPLTSSRNDLNQSYDDIITSDEAPFTTDNDDGPVSASPIPGSPTISEPKSPFLTDQADSAESVSHPHFSYLDRDFDIVLYGRSSPIKWQFAHDLLRKIQSNDAFPSTTPFEVTRPDPDRQLVRGFGSAFPKGVNITDRTGLSFAQDPDWAPTKQPSLAIVYLPASPFVLPEHSCYLPVLAHSPGRSSAITRFVAWSCWRRFSIPDEKLLPVAEPPLTSLDDLHGFSSSCLRDAMDGRIATPRRKAPLSSLQLTAGHSTAFLAVLVLMLGLAINILLRSWFSTPIPMICRPVTTVQSPKFEPSADAGQTVAHENCALIPSSLKGFALSVFNPAAEPAAQPTQPSLPTNSGVVETVRTDSSSWAECIRSGKELISRPVPSSLSFDAHSKALSIIVPAQKKAEALTNSLSLKLADTLSEMLDPQALLAMFRQDLAEVLDALDDLMRAIVRSTDAVRAQHPERMAWVLKERLQTRHGRAMKRARELREKGQRAVANAQERVMARANVAREKARNLKEVTGRMWSAHRKRKIDRKRFKRLARQRARSFLFPA